MSTPTTSPPNARPLFGAFLVLFLLVAVFVVLKLVSLLTSVVIVGLVVIGLYEAYRFLTLVRGGTPPPSSLGVLRGAGRVALGVVRRLPAFARWAGRTAHVMAHSTQEIAAGAVLGGLFGLVVGWQLDLTFIGTFLGTVGGVALGTAVGGQRLRAAQPPPPPPQQPPAPVA
jgi:hypothetical protein